MSHLNETEQRDLGELLGVDSLDDSLNDDHQSRLRSQVLEIFDHAQNKTSQREARITPPPQKSMTWTRQSLACIAALAVCAMAVISIRLLDGNASLGTSVVHEQPVDDIGEQQLLASLSTLDAFRDDVSRDEYFAAIAICQQDHEVRAMSDTEHQ